MSLQLVVVIKCYQTQNHMMMLSMKKETNRTYQNLEAVSAQLLSINMEISQVGKHGFGKETTTWRL